MLPNDLFENSVGMELAKKIKLVEINCYESTEHPNSMAVTITII